MLAKSNLNSIEVSISKVLIDSAISHDEFLLANNVLKEYDNMKEDIKNLKTEIVHQRFYSLYKTMLSYCLKCRKKQRVKIHKL